MKCACFELVCGGRHDRVCLRQFGSSSHPLWSQIKSKIKLMGINCVSWFIFFWLVSCWAHCWFSLQFAQSGSVNQGPAWLKGRCVFLGVTTSCRVTTFWSDTCGLPSLSQVSRAVWLDGMCVCFLHLSVAWFVSLACVHARVCACENQK